MEKPYIVQMVQQCSLLVLVVNIAKGMIAPWSRLNVPLVFTAPLEQSNLSLAQTVFSVIEAPQNLPRAQKVALALIPQYRIVRVEMQASILTACDKKITQVFEQP